jgi:predicted molibdopterin-dependent oxidoreductase YjgC
MVFLSFHYADVAANMLTIGALDPVAKIPELKVCAMQIKKLA